MMVTQSSKKDIWDPKSVVCGRERVLVGVLFAIVGLKGDYVKEVSNGSRTSIGNLNSLCRENLHSYG